MTGLTTTPTSVHKMAHLSPSTIFSPSVARQQLAAAKDWNYIDAWLSTKFSGKTPPFERNNETLKALLALAALNESADEECELLARVEAKALADLRAKQEADPNVEILRLIEESLTHEGQTSLETLSTLSVEMNQSIPDTERLGRGLIDLQVLAYDLEQASERISILENHLNMELENINQLIEELQSDAYRPPAELTKQMIDYQRKTKVLAAKLPELREKVASLTANGGSAKVTIQDVKAEEERFKDLTATVKDLETQVKSYHGLPQDTDLARLQLESLRVELRGLSRQRDSMFEGLVERETPWKPRY
jgi:HAUS augmin-like complex subunit 1